MSNPLENCSTIVLKQIRLAVPIRNLNYSGYCTYFYYKFPGQEMEITCDETGKVNKVIVNGKEEKDIQSYVENMFFRSW